MKRRRTLVLPQKVADQLRQHLFPGDGLEAAALLLCTQVGASAARSCSAAKLLRYRTAAAPGRAISSLGRASMLRSGHRPAAVRGDVVIAVHSHPGGLYAFSTADDESDRTLMSALRHGTDRTGRLGHHDPERRDARSPLRKRPCRDAGRSRDGRRHGYLHHGGTKARRPPDP